MLTENVTSAFIKTNGVTLHVAQAGPLDGPPVILLHGFPEFWYGWRHQIDHLAGAGFRLWIPDQRGYNLSDKPRGLRSYDVDALAADAAGVIRAAGHDRAAVVGHDWGALVAWWLALLHPALVSRLVVLNAPHPYALRTYMRTNLGQALRFWYVGMFQLPWLPEKLLGRASGSMAAKALKSTSRRGTFTDAELDAYRRAWSQPEALRCMVNWYRSYIRRPHAAPPDWRVTVPTLIIWGARDAVLGRELAQHSADLCDQGRLAIIEEATHWVQHEEPDCVNRLISEFLT